MIEFSTSITSSKTSIASYQAISERNSIEISGAEKKRPPPPPASGASGSNNQQQQIIDEVDISQAAIAQFEQAQLLIEELDNYLDYLNGQSPSDTVSLTVPTTANDNEAVTEISAQSSRLSASITVAEYSEETLSISGTIDDAGNLTALSVSKESISAQYVSANITREEFSFFARG